MKFGFASLIVKATRMVRIVRIIWIFVVSQFMQS